MISTTITSSARRVGQQLSSVARKQSQHQCLSTPQTRCFITTGVPNHMNPSPSERTFNRGFATKKKSGGDDSSSPSYFERKAAAKQTRVDSYKHKLERATRIKSRRDNSPRDVKKDEFRSWWDGRVAYEEQMNRKARQAGMDWTLKVATIVERLPIVMSDKETFEKEFEELQAYLKAHSGKEYPKEFIGIAKENRPEAYTDEELIALLPENFKPAPRETKADEEGIVNTLDRKLKDRVYLMIDGSFPTTEVKIASDDDKYGADCESLLEAAVRGVNESTSRGKKEGKGPLDLYCASQAPIGIQLDVYDEEQQKSTGSYGTKTFFVKVQYDDGMLKGDNIAWLDRSEIVEHFQSDSKDDEAKFFRYLL
eukprot:CAMPEP_0116114662 /NCGR_PEP_ID=MMETSP0329-20121206/98_1 /TAXON_ID=697910 /ORGANISM="Pseudo-nitzschia arenysensis, Strain B593" /LENGTH=366 /DNA_ID=CAMNT_0003608053 /DNA_START=111 /DNA_END=1211 /DNA_ORIENTATION=-